MRQMVSGLVAALAVVAASAVPAMACGGCLPCGYGYVSPCVPAYVPFYAGCFGCGAGFERLPDPELQYHSAATGIPQYYYVNQGPTYTGPGQFAPYRYYDVGGYGWHADRPYPRHHHHWHRYGSRPVLHSYY